MEQQTQEKVSKNEEGSEALFEENLSKHLLTGVGIFIFMWVVAQIGVAANLLKEEPIQEIGSFFKATILPVTMLILGHYFGSRANS